MGLYTGVSISDSSSMVLMVRVKCDVCVTLLVTLLNATSIRTFIMSDADEHEFRAEDDADMGDAGNAPEEDVEQDDPGVPEKRRIERDVFDEEEEDEDEEEEDEEELSGKKARKRAKVGKIVFAQTQALTSFSASSETSGSQSFHRSRSRG